MTRAAVGLLATLTLAGTDAPRLAAAQDSTQAARVTLGADPGRFVPFRREYDMLAASGDSMVSIGRRVVIVDSARFAGAPAWLVVETRSGVVPAVESLYVSPGGRALQWTASLGASRLAIAFTRDSIFGATSTPVGRQNVLHAAPANLLASMAMAELLLRGVAWRPDLSDSVSVLTVDHVSSAVSVAQLAVIGEESVTTSGGMAPGRAAWVVVLRAAGPRTALLWVDKQDGALLRLQQLLPMHGAAVLEYRPVNPP